MCMNTESGIVSEELSSVETSRIPTSLAMPILVSEELSSVETILY